MWTHTVGMTRRAPGSPAGSGCVHRGSIQITRKGSAAGGGGVGDITPTLGWDHVGTLGAYEYMCRVWVGWRPEFDCR